MSGPLRHYIIWQAFSCDPDRLPWPVRVSVFNSEDYALIFTKTPAGTTSRLSTRRFERSVPRC